MLSAFHKPSKKSASSTRIGSPIVPTKTSSSARSQGTGFRQSASGSSIARSQAEPASSQVLKRFGDDRDFATPSGVETTAAELKGTGESAYSTLIQKHLPGDVSRPFALRPIPDSFCAAPVSGQNPETV
jgi:hypothetical protein